MMLSFLLVSLIAGLTSAQWVWDPRIPKDCPVRNPGPKGLDQATVMVEALAGPQVGPEEVPQNGKVAPGSGKVKGRRCVVLDGLNCGLVTPENYAQKDGTYGTGPYKAWYSVEPALPRHTIYMPKTIPMGIKLPAIIVSNHPAFPGTFNIAMFVEWASHGFVVIATGTTTANQTNKGSNAIQRALIEDAINFVFKRAGTQNYTQVDSSRIGVSGLHLGGPSAYDYARDSRITSLALMNTGPEYESWRTVVEPSKSDKPTAFFLGGQSDTATMHAERDFEDIANGTPKWKGHLDTGDLGTYCQPQGGQFGTASGNWWKWTLGGDSKAGEYFTGLGASSDGWRTFWEDLDKLKVPTPLLRNQ